MRLKGLKQIRQDAKKTQVEVAAALGFNPGTYRNWEQLISSPRSRELEMLADYFDCKVDELFGRSLPPGAIRPVGVPTVLIPVYGRIAAGTPVEMIEAVEEAAVPITKREKYPYSYFLIVSGDSMDREVLDGSYALIDPAAEVRNGDTVAVNVNGYDATLKVWHKTSNSVILSPNSTNPEHEDIVINEKDPDAPNLRVLGKKVWAMYPDKDC